MRLPIKLNNRFWPGFIKIFVGANYRQDPAVLINNDSVSADVFSKAITNFKFGTTFKTTRPGRHEQADRIILKYFNPGNVILDVGVSDGSTSLDLIKKTNFQFGKYFVTDYHIEVLYYNVHGVNYFYDPKTRDMILYSNLLWVVYPQESNLAKLFSSHRLKMSQEIEKKTKSRLLIQPELEKLSKENPKIKIQQFNVFDVWQNDSPDIIKVCNVLNRDYFSDEMIKIAVGNFKMKLNEDGYLLVSDNRDIEKVSLFKKSGDKFELVENFNGGSEIENLVS